MATSEYIPAVPPNELSPQARRFLDTELRAIADQINSTQFCLPPLAAAPAKPENGVIVYADGTNWNPGSGEGFYGYQAGAWVKL